MFSSCLCVTERFCFFFFNDTATTEIYTLSLHDALPIFYDRLSPSSDLSPKWYCERCSVEKNLQRDFRDIKGEFEKLTKGAASVLGQADQLGRATLRLKEIAAMLAVDALKPTLLKPEAVAALTRSLETRRTASIV